MMNSDFAKRRVVIYARVSTEHEAQLSALENQMDWYKPIMAARPEWTLVGQYIDEGITGTSAEKRPRFMKMIRDAKKRKFDLVITREVSRFARNTVDTLQYTRMLRAVGVEVFFINDNIKTFDGDGELRLSLMATLAQDESRKTSIRVKSGQQTSMENGVVYGNGNILGYDRVGKEMVINPEQAETVRLIFDMYLDGEGLMAIKNELERRGRRTAMGKSRWHCTVISHVLKNTFYYGVMTYHKEFTPDYLTQKKIRNYGEVEPVQAQGTHQPIVTREEFERVQRIMNTKREKRVDAQRGERRYMGKHPRSTVWGKLLICSCGRRFSKRVWTRTNGKADPAYLCYGVIQNGSYESRKKRGLPLEGACRTPMIPEWRLQMMANLIFRDYLADKERVLALANSMLADHIGDAEEREDVSADLERKRAELDKLNRKFDNLVEMRSDGEIGKDMFRAKCDELEPRMDRLRREIGELEAKEAPPEVADYEEKLTVLRYALERYTDFSEDRDVPENVIEAFVEKIVASPEGFDWYLRFGGDPDDPIRCKVEGKRRPNVHAVVLEGASPSAHLSGTTGAYRWCVFAPKE